MDNLGAASLRSRRLESCFNTSYEPIKRETPKCSVDEQQIRRMERADFYVDDNGWSSVLISCFRIVTCFLAMMVTTSIWALIMLVLLPWPYQRIRQGNIYGHVTGRLLMWILGNPIKIEGSEFCNERAIYICNHASPLDIFLIMWLTPTGSVGIAKKEIIWYPLFGQLYILANHLRIDRSNPVAAVESMKQVARAVSENNLSLIIFPEGTRSKDGRLLPFKKGFVHLALQTQLPIVPIVFTGTHRAWRKGSLHVRPAPLTVKYLPPITTYNWTVEKIDDYMKTIHNVYVKYLPESQRPS
ncbi:1-acyl-sn-glycerol-3-phosphate acyltransferase-like [Momordica charantia]|uniref:1-acyl-sn-glycerol-3-phosphate acyltransferase n=1 Tax=Momordica charantia TaxID=3673 RepID=A0A6J1DBN2_MOMCH|nr:1-acyl-sn-glycerol-3-phosphate acyltransferase-like [Momordica charantia]WDW26426.1 1-acyl-sn-glycerol-3-phosphate acyltransferase [Momordica charantia]